VKSCSASDSEGNTQEDEEQKIITLSKNNPTSNFCLPATIKENFEVLGI